MDPHIISQIRGASRDLVRKWGFLGRTIGGVGLSGSAVHAILEIGQAGELTARDLSLLLGLEKSSVSRLVKTLIQRGEIREMEPNGDGRTKPLQLTQQGKTTFATIDQKARAQVEDALSDLDAHAQQGIARAFTQYAQAVGPAAPLVSARPSIEIRTGYTPGLIGRMAQLLAVRMLRDYPFGVGFEARVATDLAEFLPRATRPVNKIWHARFGERIVGGITIDGEDLGDGLAHLRWFVLDDDMVGTGVGQRLMAEALAHCDLHGFREIHLWTGKGLDVAGHIYRKYGFDLVDEFEGDQWGSTIVEQKYVKVLA